MVAWGCEAGTSLVTLSGSSQSTGGKGSPTAVRARQLFEERWYRCEQGWVEAGGSCQPPAALLKGKSVEERLTPQSGERAARLAQEQRGCRFSASAYRRAIPSYLAVVGLAVMLVAVDVRLVHVQGGHGWIVRESRSLCFDRSCAAGTVNVQGVVGGLVIVSALPILLDAMVGAAPTRRLATFCRWMMVLVGR